MRTKMIACVREVRERNLLWRMVRVDDTSVNIKRLTIRPTEPRSDISFEKPAPIFKLCFNNILPNRHNFIYVLGH